MTKKEVLQKIAYNTHILNAEKGLKDTAKYLGKTVGDTKSMQWLRGNNARASDFFSKTNILAKLLMGPLPVPGGIAAGAALKTGINGVQAANEVLIKHPKLMNGFQKSLNVARMIIPT